MTGRFFNKLFWLSFIFTAHPVEARIINIPADFNSIQFAITNSARDHDTILVQTGVYPESINFQGLNIVVASLILTTGDPAYIDSTIIDGGRRGVPISFQNQEDSSAVLMGFTVRNFNDGGALFIAHASPTLANLSIIDNTTTGIICAAGGYLRLSHSLIARNRNGGIYMVGREAFLNDVEISHNLRFDGGGGMMLSDVNFPVVLENVSIHDNVSDGPGGGIYAVYTVINADNCSFLRNQASWGGAIFAWMETELNLNYTLIADNFAEEGIGAIVLDDNDHQHLFNHVTITENRSPQDDLEALLLTPESQVTFINSIIYGNGDRQINLPEGGTLNMSYTILENGEDGVLGREFNLNLGGGMFEDDPLFAEDTDYLLSADSPAIDAGDPDAPRDPDSTRTDMGWRFFNQEAYLFGIIIDASDRTPLSGAEITTDRGVMTIANEDGSWEMNAAFGEFSITASHPGHNDLTRDVNVELLDTLEVNFELLNPLFQSSVDSLRVTVPLRSEVQRDFELRNEADGNLIWSAQSGLPGEAGLAPWELRRSYNIGAMVNDERIEGVAFVQDLYYITGRNDFAPVIYVLNPEGRLLDAFDQPGEDAEGMRDLTWDGQRLWGVAQDIVYGFNLIGELRRQFQVHFRPAACIAWDPDRELLWICGTTTNISAYNRNGERQDLDINRCNLRIYGLAYWEDDPDNHNLYVFLRDRDTGGQMVHKIDPDLSNANRSDTIRVAALNPADGGTPGGCFIAGFNHNLSSVFITVSNCAVNMGGDRINIWQLQSNPFWLSLEPSQGGIAPGTARILTATFRTVDPRSRLPLDLGIYNGEFRFEHNAAGGEAVIPVEMTVIRRGGVEDKSVPPSDYMLLRVHPNPFNSRAVIDYKMPQAGHLAINIFNLQGRMMENIFDGFVSNGQNQIVWNAVDVPAGIYLINVQMGEIQRTFKIALIK